MQQRQDQAEAKNAAPKNQPPAGMTVTQHSMGHPGQSKQASPFEQDYKRR
jgi:hypothetical protein